MKHVTCHIVQFERQTQRGGGVEAKKHAIIIQGYNIQHLLSISLFSVIFFLSAAILSASPCCTFLLFPIFPQQLYFCYHCYLSPSLPLLFSSYALHYLMLNVFGFRHHTNDFCTVFLSPKKNLYRFFNITHKQQGRRGICDTFWVIQAV